MSRILLVSLIMLGLATPSLAGDKALLGALIGAGAGAAIGHSVKRGGGAGTGAAIGAVGGYVIGSQMEKSSQGQAASAPQREAQGGAQLSSSSCRKADDYVGRASGSASNADKVYYLQEAVRLCPDNARAHNDLGVAYYTRNGVHDGDRARAEFNEALRIDPDYTVARDNLRRL